MANSDAALNRVLYVLLAVVAYLFYGSRRRGAGPSSRRARDRERKSAAAAGPRRARRRRQRARARRKARRARAPSGGPAQASCAARGSCGSRRSGTTATSMPCGPRRRTGTWAGAWRIWRAGSTRSGIWRTPWPWPSSSRARPRPPRPWCTRSPTCARSTRSSASRGPGSACTRGARAAVPAPGSSEEESRPGRGPNRPRGRVAAPPRSAGQIVRGSRGAAAGRGPDRPRKGVAAPPRDADRIVRGGASRRRRGARAGGRNRRVLPADRPGRVPGHERPVPPL